MKKATPRSATWGTAYDKYGDPSGDFSASRQGLVYLRSKIDEALVRGEAQIEEGSQFDFERIKIEEIHPFELLAPNPIGDAIFKFVIISLGIGVIGLTAYGAIQFWENVVR